MILLVMATQTQVYREVTNLFALTGKNKDEAPIVEDKKKRDPWSKTLNWYFFAVLNYFLYGESMIYYFKVHCISRLVYVAMLIHYFTARCLRGRPILAFRQQSPLHQLHALRVRLHGLCRIAQEAVFTSAVRSLWLGSYESSGDCRLEVRCPVTGWKSGIHRLFYT